LFIDFATGGQVHTAAFTVEGPDPALIGDAPTAPEAADDEHGSH
jgi:hypothetical protein